MLIFHGWAMVGLCEVGVEGLGAWLYTGATVWFSLQDGLHKFVGFSDTIMSF